MTDDIMVQCPICQGNGGCVGKPQSCKGCTFNKAKPNGVKCHLDGKCPTCKGTGVVKEEDLLAFEKAYGSPDAS